MAFEGFRQLRVWFSKTGNAKYISHLDLNRCMTRAVRRARLPLWYTEGFNPHPYITFALPLPLGQESEAEPMDIRLTGDMNKEEIKTRLAAVMPEGIDILEVDEPRFDPKEICCAEYEIFLEFADKTEASTFSEKAAVLLEEGSLTAQKPGKKGRQKVMKEVNLSEHILKQSMDCSQNKVCLNVILSAGNTVNLNPSLLLESLNKAIGFEAQSTRIIRKKLLMAGLEEFR